VSGDAAAQAAPAKKRGDLATRFLSVIFLIPLLILVIWWKDQRGVFAVVLLATGIALNEFFTMTLKDGFERVVGVVLGLAFSAMYFWRPQYFVPGLTALVMLAFGVLLFRFGDMSTVGNRVALLVLGVLYAGFLFTHLSLAKTLPFGEHGGWVLLILTINWFADTGAYLVGRAIGKHKLYPAVSPGKSVEGAIGGVVASVGAAVIAKLWYLKVLGWDDVILIGAPASILGQIGDLCESMLKRAVGVKDSGKLLPGHGGILDRVDAVLFGAPYVFWYAILKMKLVHM
jgi:phosphatidate cytidylyltransferase